MFFIVCTLLSISNLMFCGNKSKYNGTSRGSDQKGQMHYQQPQPQRTNRTFQVAGNNNAQTANTRTANPAIVPILLAITFTTH